MRILAVTPYYDPEGGGLERYAHSILQRLAARGHEVQALSFKRSGPEQLERDGVQVQRTQPMLRLGNSPLHPAFPRQVRQQVQEFQPDVLLAHTPVPFAAEMAYFANRGSGVPFVATYHAGRLRGSSRALDLLAALDRATLERRMLSGADRLVAVTPYVRDHALHRQAGRVDIIPPGVDSQRLRPARRPSAQERILFVAPLSSNYRWKGVDVLWEAFLRLRRSRPNLQLVLVGEGDRLPEFAHRARLGGGCLQLPGRLTEAQLAAEYQRASVVVLPSTSDAESFGMVLAEANACGRPVVASNIGGIPDFVRDHDNGLLARPGDPRDLAEKLAEVLGDPDAACAMGRRGRRKVVRDHDWDRLAVTTEGVLERVVAER